MYNNAYYNPYGQQSLSDRIDNQIAQLTQMKEQMKNQQPAINQTFQLAPTGTNTLRYANTIDDVSKEIIYGDTPFFSKDMSVVWVKNTKGNIKTYELKEIIPMDSKDIQIQYLQTQIEELKGMMKNDANVTNVITKQDATGATTNDDAIGEEFESKKSTSISKISRSKKE